MKPFRSLSAVEQLAAYLREEIRSGGLDDPMPGVAGMSFFYFSRTEAQKTQKMDFV